MFSRFVVPDPPMSRSLDPGRHSVCTNQAPGFHGAGYSNSRAARAQFRGTSTGPHCRVAIDARDRVKGETSIRPGCAHSRNARSRFSLRLACKSLAFEFSPVPAVALSLIIRVSSSPIHLSKRHPRRLAKTRWPCLSAGGSLISQRVGTPDSTGPRLFVQFLASRVQATTRFLRVSGGASRRRDKKTRSMGREHAYVGGRSGRAYRQRRNENARSFRRARRFDVAGTRRTEGLTGASARCRCCAPHAMDAPLPPASAAYRVASARDSAAIESRRRSASRNSIRAPTE